MDIQSIISLTLAGLAILTYILYIIYVSVNKK